MNVDLFANASSASETATEHTLSRAVVGLRGGGGIQTNGHKIPMTAVNALP